MYKRQLLVTGASGKLGHRVVELLLAQNLHNTRIIATTRSPEKLADLAAKGAEIRKADFDAPATLVEAFKGADRILLISTSAITPENARYIQQKAALDAAIAAGVKHVLFTSVVKPSKEHPVSFVRGGYQPTEEAIKASNVDYTIIRNGYWMDSLLFSLPYAVASGKFATATNGGHVTFTTREESAIVAAAELASFRTGRSVIDNTGANRYNYEEIAKIASEVTGKPVVHVSVTLEQKTQALLGAGLPPVAAEAIASFDAAVAGANQVQ